MLPKEHPTTPNSIQFFVFCCRMRCALVGQTLRWRKEEREEKEEEKEKEVEEKRDQEEKEEKEEQQQKQQQQARRSRRTRRGGATISAITTAAAGTYANLIYTTPHCPTLLRANRISSKSLLANLISPTTSEICHY